MMRNADAYDCYIGATPTTPMQHTKLAQSEKQQQFMQ